MKYNDNGEYKDIYIKTFDTLPVGTEVDYDGETVPDGWSEVNNGWLSLGNTIYCKKVGNIVTVRGWSNGTVALTANDYKILATLPAELKPSMDLVFPWSRIGSGPVCPARIHGDTGVIDLYSDDAGSYWAFTITYVL